MSGESNLSDEIDNWSDDDGYDDYDYDYDDDDEVPELLLTMENIRKLMRGTKRGLRSLPYKPSRATDSAIKAYPAFCALLIHDHINKHIHSFLFQLRAEYIKALHNRTYLSMIPRDMQQIISTSMQRNTNFDNGAYYTSMLGLPWSHNGKSADKHVSKGCIVMRWWPNLPGDAHREISITPGNCYIRGRLHTAEIHMHAELCTYEKCDEYTQHVFTSQEEIEKYAADLQQGRVAPPRI